MTQKGPSPSWALRGGQCISICLSFRFKSWHFGNHSYLAVFNGKFVNVLILAVAVLTWTWTWTCHKTGLSVLIIVQRDATQRSLFIILQVHSTCYWCHPHPTSEVHKTVTSASGTGHIFCAATSLQRGQAWPEAVVTVLCTPVERCGWHPKHVEWTCRINRLLCVASRWTILNIDQRCTEP